MADFKKAIGPTLVFEGGYTNDPNDPGGATNFGISLRFLRDANEYELGDIDKDGDIDANDVKQLTVDRAIQIYKKHFWDKYNYGLLHDQDIANKLFDMTVNMGPSQSHKIAQRALRAVGIKGVVDDGILGPRSLEAIQRVYTDDLEVAYLAAVRSEQAGFYRVLAATKPSLGKFLNGWLNRAYSH